MNAVAYLNGEFLPPQQCRIDPFDRGFLFGDGVYEVMPVYDGQAFLLDEHLKRLAYSLEQIDIANPHTNKQWKDIINTLIRKADTPQLNIYLQVTRGVAPRDHVSVTAAPTVFAATMEADPISYLSKGVSAITVEDFRWERCDIKSINLLANVMMRRQAKLNNAHEAIIIKDGYVLEGAASNVLIAKEQTIFTPPLSRYILAGVTRTLVMTLAQEEGFDCKEQPITADRLYTADEVWLSSSTKNILPVVKINQTLVGDGTPGNIWQHVSDRIEAYKG